MQSSGSENRAEVWQRQPDFSQYPHPEFLCVRKLGGDLVLPMAVPHPPTFSVPQHRVEWRGWPYLCHPVKSLFSGDQAGEIEALEDVESTDEGRACVRGWGTENQVAWKDRKWPDGRDSQGISISHHHIDWDHSTELPHQIGKKWCQAKGHMQVHMASQGQGQDSNSEHWSSVSSSIWFARSFNEGTAGTDVQMFRFLAHHHRAGYYSGPLMVPPLKLLGSSNLLFLYKALVIRCLDTKGIIISDITQTITN